MWNLYKPKLSDAKNDIDVVVSHCYNLDDSDKRKWLSCMRIMMRVREKLHHFNFNR